MHSITELAAHALASRWGRLEEEPPEWIDPLMTELTVALRKAEEAGDKTRAERLDAVIAILARGIAEHKRQTEGGFHTATLERAMAEIRAHQHRAESDLKESNVSGRPPRGRRVGAAQTLRVEPCQR